MGIQGESSPGKDVVIIFPLPNTSAYNTLLFYSDWFSYICLIPFNRFEHYGVEWALLCTLAPCFTHIKDKPIWDIIYSKSQHLAGGRTLIGARIIFLLNHHPRHFIFLPNLYQIFPFINWPIPVVLTGRVLCALGRHLGLYNGSTLTVFSHISLIVYNHTQYFLYVVVKNLSFIYQHCA